MLSFVPNTSKRSSKNGPTLKKTKKNIDVWASELRWGKEGYFCQKSALIYCR